MTRLIFEPDTTTPGECLGPRPRMTQHRGLGGDRSPASSHVQSLRGNTLLSLVFEWFQGTLGFRTS